MKSEGILSSDESSDSEDSMMVDENIILEDGSLFSKKRWVDDHLTNLPQEEQKVKDG